MSTRELDAAGITDPGLRRGYTECRRLLARYGRTYYLASLLLPPASRPYVHALYGFARYADEIVDDTARTDPADRAARMDALQQAVLARVLDARPEAPVQAGSRPAPDGQADLVLAALRDTVHRFALPAAHFEAFLRSMRQDLTVGTYATWDDLMAYMYGSAAVIGLQMVPILGTAEPGMQEHAAPYAADLGIAFQLTNFVRDVGEDLRRGRIYLPLEDLAMFGVTREHLAAGVVDAPVRRLLAFEIARTREIFRTAAAGLRLLHPASRDCMHTALVLYRGILDAVEAADYQVLDRRCSVPGTRRLAVAAPALVRARRARRSAPAPTVPSPAPAAWAVAS